MKVAGIIEDISCKAGIGINTGIISPIISGSGKYYSVLSAESVNHLTGIEKYRIQRHNKCSRRK